MNIDINNNTIVTEPSHVFWVSKNSKPGNIFLGGIVKKKDLKAHMNKLDSFVKSKGSQRAYDYLERGGLL